MCSRTTCSQCKKPTWSGCGEHIEQALDGVAIEDRCQGHHDEPVGSGIFSKMFGKKS